MAWTYLAESAELATPCDNGLLPSPIAKLTISVKECSFPEWPTDQLHVLRSGMTCLRFRTNNSRESLISFMEVSRAKISALQDLEKDWKESEADYFSRSFGCVATLSLDLSFWKMFQPLLEGVEWPFLGNLPRWGMTRAGALYPLRPLAPLISASVGSYWLTPGTMDHLPIREGEALEKNLIRGRSNSRRKCSSRLNEQVVYPEMYPTPTVCGNHNRKGSSKKSGDGLATKVKMLPTPCARDWKDNGISPSEMKRNSPSLPAIAIRLSPQNSGKKLCPRWVSVLMGYPTTHTDLEPWAMEWYLSKSKKRSKY